MAIEKSGRIRIFGEVKVKGFSDFKAKVDTAIGAASKLVGVFDKVMTRSGKLAGMMSGQTINIEKAADATGGLIKKYDLLAAANRGVALGIDLTDEKFAELAKSAAIVAQKLGTDVNDAIGDLMLGLGRQSKMILDNLGILVDVKRANEEYAASLGKTTNQLTDAEKKIAFQTAALKELNRIAGDGKLETESLSASWKKFKNQLVDSVDDLSLAARRAGLAAFAFKFWGKQVENLTKWLKKADASKSIQRFLLGQDVKGPLTAKSFGDEPESGPSPFKGGQRVFLGGGEGIGTGLFSTRTGFRETQRKDVEKADRKRASDAKKRAREMARERKRIDKLLDVRESGFTFESLGLDPASDEEKAAQQKRQNELARGAEASAQALETQFKASLKAAEGLDKYNEQVKKTKDSVKDLALGPMVDLVGGMWAAADAAIHSGASFGEAMRVMVKATLLGIAQQATVESIFQLAKAFAALASPVTAPLAALHFKSAALFASIGVGAGVGGVLMAPASPASTGGRSGGRSGSAAPTRNFGSRRTDEQRTIIVNLHMGGRFDPAASIWAREQIEAQVNAA